MSKPETIVCEIYDAWRAQDMDWLASYLPHDFCHITHAPIEFHPLGGLSRGKTAAIERLGVIADDFEILRFDTSGLMVQNERAGVDIPVHYRHRETGIELETTIANFWLFEDGWPTKLSEYHNLVHIQDFQQAIEAATTIGT